MNPHITQFGFVCFMRNDGTKDMEQRCYQFYRTNVLIPFVQHLRAQHSGWKDGDDIDASLVGATETLHR